MRLLRHGFPLLALLALLTWPLAAAGAEGPYSLVRVDLSGPAGAAFLPAHPGLDVATVKPGVVAEIVADADDLAVIRASGVSYTVVHEDLVAFYASRITSRDDGNFGRWHTYSENTAFVDSLRMLHPEVVSAKWSIGQSGGMRHIWCFRVSDNPDVDENEPEILLDGMHHAREIMASEFAIMFAEYLASNYGVDPVVTWLVDNRELYIVPIMNPDGVVYNEQTDPQGGGMWRKNRRLNTGGSYGVDLNRNYPFHWGEEGASAIPSDDTYRGPSAGSEPETQALMALINAHDFITHQSIHTYANLTLFPWGYTSANNPEYALYSAMATIMTQTNGYEWGSPPDLLYTTSGSTTDWAYGGAGHAPILTFSNEIGNDGFWPADTRRGALFSDNLWMMLYLMMAAGEYAEVDSPQAVDTFFGPLDPGESGTLNVTVTNRAARAALSGVTLTFACDDPYVQFGAATRTLGSIAAMGTADLGANRIPVTVNTACPAGHLVPFTVTVDWGTGEMSYDLAFMVGSPTTIFQDNFSGGLGNWTLSGNWGLTGTAHTAPYALTDSPSGDYGDQVAWTATLNGSYHASRLTFWHRYDLEDDYDYGRVQVSASGGPWTTVVSYTGTHTAWQQITVDLGAFAGQSLRLRFLLESDVYITEDGWYIDDVVLLGAGGTNVPPAPPALIAPAEGASVGGSPVLTVANSDDPDGAGPVTYGFRIYNDALLTQVAATVSGVAEGAGQTSWTAPNLAGGTYWWRAFAADPTEWGLFGDVRSFSIATTGIDGVTLAGPRLAVLGSGGGTAELQLTLGRASDVQVRIFNARGQQVRDLFTGDLASGQQVLTWNGRDGSGRSVASGVYFARVTAGGETLTGRVLIVR